MRTLISCIYIYNSLAYFQDVFVLEFSHDQDLSPAKCGLFCCEYLAMVAQLKKKNTAKELHEESKEVKSILKY